MQIHAFICKHYAFAFPAESGPDFSDTEVMKAESTVTHPNSNRAWRWQLAESTKGLTHYAKPSYNSLVLVFTDICTW